MCVALCMQNSDKGRGGMAGGYIKLYRRIREHWVWDNSDYLKWWLDLLMLANHKPTKIVINGRLHTIGKGMYHTSEIKLAERWFISRMTVNRFLKLLESDGMIEVLRSRQDGTTIKVSNYTAYQGIYDDRLCNEIDNEIDNDSATKVHKQEIEEGEEVKKEPFSSEPPAAAVDGESPNVLPDKRHRVKPHYEHDSTYYRAAEWLANAIYKRVPDYKPITEAELQNWANEARLMVERDKRDGREVNALLRFSQDDSFWQNNIRSMGKFRAQYENLRGRYRSAESKTNPVKQNTGYINLADLVGDE